jgi:capsular exopolysaccharide synthesis family protein
MSRIHEALKKAAQERSSQLAAGSGRVSVEVAGELRQAVATERSFTEVPRQDRASVADNQAGPLEYEALVKRCAHPTWRLDAMSSVFQNASAGNGVSERFRTLRSRLLQTATTRTLRRLLITSSIAGEGKTFVASNLAQSIVQQPERRVLLIDADLRAPRLHSAFGASRFPGLADYLRGDADECKVIQKGMEENLCLIAAGSPVSKPSELLLSERMKDLLDSLTPLFDWIIIDSPPTLPVHDSSILAGLTDGVLLVLQAGVTPMAAAEKATEEFKQKNLLGVIFNQVQKSDSYGEYEYNYRAAPAKTP